MHKRGEHGGKERRGVWREKEGCKGGECGGEERGVREGSVEGRGRV